MNSEISPLKSRKKTGHKPVFQQMVDPQGFEPWTP